MKYIVFNKTTNKVIHILDKEPKAVSDGLGVAECSSIPNGKIFIATNLQNHEETYNEVVVDYDDNGNEIPREVKRVRKWQTCNLVEDIAESLKIDRKSEIASLKAKLSATDYIVIKIAEEMTNGNTETVNQLKITYAKELANRKVWRNRINELEQ